MSFTEMKHAEVVAIPRGFMTLLKNLTVNSSNFRTLVMDALV